MPLPNTRLSLNSVIGLGHASLHSVRCMPLVTKNRAACLERIPTNCSITLHECSSQAFEWKDRTCPAPIWALRPEGFSPAGTNTAKKTNCYNSATQQACTSGYFSSVHCFATSLPGTFTAFYFLGRAIPEGSIGQWRSTGSGNNHSKELYTS
ncbi:hypothetical protein ABBQ32_14178 [Trebouxia sp. C0010 RCD-2024]